MTQTTAMQTEPKGRNSTVATRACDVGGAGHGRTARQALFRRCLLVGSFGGGPSLRQLVTLGVLHRLGAPLYRLLMTVHGPLYNAAARFVHWRRRGRKSAGRHADSRGG